MVASAHDEGDASPNPHAGDLTPPGQVQGDLQLLGGHKFDAVSHGLGGDPRRPGQDAAVGHKGAQSQPGQLLPNAVLVLRQVHRGPQPFSIYILIKEGLLRALGQEVEEDLPQLPGVDRPAVGRKAHLEAHQDVSALRVQTAGGPLQHLLAAAAHGDEAALAGALGLEGEPLRRRAEPPGQLVLEGDPPVGPIVELRGEARRPPFHQDAQPGGGGEGVPLDVVDGEDIVWKLIGPPGVLVGRVPPAVDSVEQASQLRRCLHGSFLPCLWYFGAGD